MSVTNFVSWSEITLQAKPLHGMQFLQAMQVMQIMQAIKLNASHDRPAHHTDHH